MTDILGLTAERALAYSPLSFLREERETLSEHVMSGLVSALDAGELQTTGERARWCWRRMGWDSDYFGVSMYRIDAATWADDEVDPVSALVASAGELLGKVGHDQGTYYVWGELPAEDTSAIQALGRAGFRLVETRLTYYLPDASSLEWPEDYQVRIADLKDIPHLRSVAAAARNRFDRYHADGFFGTDVADRYLATYAEESVAGLADLVVVPDPGDGRSPGAFFSATVSTPPICPVGGEPSCGLRLAVGRIPLVAVGHERAGWHLKLLVATTRLLAARSARLVCMTTQATNRAVIRNCEKVGYRLGRVTHVFVASNGSLR